MNRFSDLHSFPKIVYHVFLPKSTSGARINNKNGDNIKRKLPFSLHDDISRTGSRIETNVKAFQKERFRFQRSFIRRPKITVFEVNGGSKFS